MGFSTQWKAVLAAGVLLGAAGVAWGVEWRAGRVEGGVRIEGVPVGGESVAVGSLRVEGAQGVRKSPPDVVEEWGEEWTKGFWVEAEGEFGASVEVEFQRCEEGMCLLPEVVAVPMGGEGVGGGGKSGGEEGEVGEGGEGAGRGRVEVRRWDGGADVESFRGFLRGEADARTERWRWRGWWVTLLLVFLGGVALNLTPCVLPMIPVTLLILGAGRERGWRGAGLGVAYGAGMAGLYGGLGAAAAAGGAAFGTWAGSIWVQWGMAAALVALGLAGLGAWNLDLSRWRRAGGGGAEKGYGARLAAAFGAGAGAALLAGACVAPGLAAVLALAAERHASGMPGAWALPAAMGVGLAAPWPVLAAGLAKAPRAGRWTGWLGKALGAAILAMGVGYGVRAARATWGGGEAAAGEGPGVTTIDLGAFPDAESIRAAAEAASGEGAALWEFTADWCGTCRQMERGTLAQLEREGAFEGMRRVRLKANEPGKGGAREFLKEEGVRGFPVFSVRAAGGRKAGMPGNRDAGIPGRDAGTGALRAE